jgi:predicted HicB family RNase H-like nuclease
MNRQQREAVELQLFRVRKSSHQLAKAAAAAVGVPLEIWASDALEAAAQRQMARAGRGK